MARGLFGPRTPGPGESRRHGVRRGDAGARVRVRAQRRYVGCVRAAPGRVALGDVQKARCLGESAVQAEIASPIFKAGRWVKDDCALVHPGRLAAELARVAGDLGVEIHEHSAVIGLDSSRTGPVGVRTARGSVTSEQVALATNVFKPLLWRSRLMTVPVYDYVLMTEPLSSSQKAAVGWNNRQGLADLANQFHYSRLTQDNRILYGGYDAVYHAGRKVRTEYEDRRSSHERLASHFLTTFPQLEGIRFSHRWAGAIDTSTQFCAFHGLARRGRVAYTAGFTGLGVAATRFAAEVMLDRLSGETTERTSWRWCERSRCHSRRSHSQRWESRRRSGHLIVPTTTKAAATCFCVHSIDSVWGSTHDRPENDRGRRNGQLARAGSAGSSCRVRWIADRGLDGSRGY